MTDVVKDIANLVTQDLLKVAKAMAEESAKAQQDAIATMGLTNIRGTVVAVDANNKVQIRRSTSLNDDATPGPADPGFYPVASPGVLPQVGDLVWGFANNGGAVIMGKEAASGYRDIPAVDASVTSVRQGGVDDFSLLNSKYATGSNDARTTLDESLTGSEIQNRGLSGNTELALLSVTGGELASRTITASQKIALSSLTDNEVQSRTLTGNSIALENVGNAEVSDGSIRTNEISDRTIAGGDVALNAIGNVEVAAGSMRGTEVMDRSLGGIDVIAEGIGNVEIANGSVRSTEITDSTIIGADIGTAAIGSDEISDGSVRTQEIAFHTILGEDVADAAIGTRELSGSNLSSPGHTHSSAPFVRYSEDERKEMLAIRAQNHALVEHGSSEEVKTLAEALEVNFKLHMDYPQMDAYQREKRLKEDPEWARQYIDEYFVGRWGGFEPPQILDLEEQERRRVQEIENPEILHKRTPERMVW